VVEASELSSSTVFKTVPDVRTGVEVSDRQRAAGGGDRPAINMQPGLLEALDELVHPGTRGSPMSPLRWMLQSTYELAATCRAGVSSVGGTGALTLHQVGYSLEAPSKQNEGTSYPERDRQFTHINRLAGEGWRWARAGGGRAGAQSTRRRSWSAARPPRMAAGR
jgi:hypothetical protein